MDSPTGVIPENLMYRNQRKNVRTWLILQPWPGHVKRDYLFAWARTVAVKLREWEVRQVESSGVKE